MIIRKTKLPDVNFMLRKNFLALSLLERKIKNYERKELLLTLPLLNAKNSLRLLYEAVYLKISNC